MEQFIVGAIRGTHSSRTGGHPETANDVDDDRHDDQRQQRHPQRNDGVLSRQATAAARSSPGSPAVEVRNTVARPHDRENSGREIRTFPEHSTNSRLPNEEGGELLSRHNDRSSVRRRSSVSNRRYQPLDHSGEDCQERLHHQRSQSLRDAIVVDEDLHADHPYLRVHTDPPSSVNISRSHQGSHNHHYRSPFGTAFEQQSADHIFYGEEEYDYVHHDDEAEYGSRGGSFFDHSRHRIVHRLPAVASPRSPGGTEPLLGNQASSIIRRKSTAAEQLEAAASVLLKGIYSAIGRPGGTGSGTGSFSSAPRHQDSGNRISSSSSSSSSKGTLIKVSSPEGVVVSDNSSSLARVKNNLPASPFSSLSVAAAQGGGPPASPSPVPSTNHQGVRRFQDPLNIMDTHSLLPAAQAENAYHSMDDDSNVQITQAAPHGSSAASCVDDDAIDSLAAEDSHVDADHTIVIDEPDASHTLQPIALRRTVGSSTVPHAVAETPLSQRVFDEQRRAARAFSEWGFALHGSAVAAHQQSSSHIASCDGGPLPSAGSSSPSGTSNRASGWLRFSESTGLSRLMSRSNSNPVNRGDSLTPPAGGGSNSRTSAAGPGGAGAGGGNSQRRWQNKLKRKMIVVEIKDGCTKRIEMQTPELLRIIHEHNKNNLVEDTASGSVKLRDLRQVVSQPITGHRPSIEPRRNCVLVNLPKIRCVILHNKIFVIPLWTRDVPFGGRNPSDEEEDILGGGDDSPIGSGASQDKSTVTTSPGPGSLLERLVRLTSMKTCAALEYIALEAILIEECSILNEAIAPLKASSEILMRAIRSEPSKTTRLHDITDLKRRIDTMSDRVRGCQRALQEVLNNEEDIRRLEISRFWDHPEQWDQPSDTPASEDAEILLECYEQEVESFITQLNRMDEALDDALQIQQLHLASIRNLLIKSELAIEILGLAVGLVAAIAGIFGMNVPNGYEETDGIFWPMTNSFLILVAVTGLIVVWLFRRLQL